MTEQIFYECVDSKCLAGMETFKYEDDTIGKHRVSFEAPIGEFTLIKKGQMLPNTKCYRCRKKTLIRD